MSDAPAFLIDELRQIVGPSGSVENATGLLIDSGDGLRVVNEVEQLAYFEWASCQTSQGVRNLVFGLRPGLSELQAARLLEWTGTPLSCHLMLTAGPRARFGLLSPSDRKIQRGDPFTTAFGIWGALNCRAGFVVADARGLPVPDYVERLVAPYFDAVAEWYRALRVGVSGGALHDIVRRRLGDPFFGVFLNPATSCTSTSGSTRRSNQDRRSSSAPGWRSRSTSSPRPGPSTSRRNIEDGVAVADEPLRREFATKFPAAWQRIEERRGFMSNVLGIELHPDVLPFSNIPAWLPPFLLDPGSAMALG
jgi:hypothetical protein